MVKRYARFLLPANQRVGGGQISGRVSRIGRLRRRKRQSFDGFLILSLHEINQAHSLVPTPA